MAKHKYIETPEKMWELFMEYVNHTKSRSRNIEKATPKGVVVESHTPPLTMSGFRVYGHTKGVTVHHYFSNSDDSYNEYRSICSRIEDCIRQDQVEGGMVGQYNPSITQRLNGLTDKTENKNENTHEIKEVKIEIKRNNE